MQSHKRAILLAICILVMVSFILLSLHLRKRVEVITYERENNIYIRLEGGEEKQITIDGIVQRGVKYGYPAVIEGEYVVRYIRCWDSVELGDNNKCEIYEYSIDDEVQKSIYDLSSLGRIDPDSIQWDPLGRYLVISSPYELYMFTKAEGLKGILNWEILDLGIGGRFCDGTVIKNDGRFFVFCAASASTTSIQGELHLFDSDGNKINTFHPELARQGYGLIEPEFIGDSLVYFDDSTSTNWKYDLGSEVLSKSSN